MNTPTIIKLQNAIDGLVATIGRGTGALTTTPLPQPVGFRHYCNCIAVKMGRGRNGPFLSNGAARDAGRAFLVAPQAGGLPRSPPGDRSG